MHFLLKKQPPSPAISVHSAVNDESEEEIDMHLPDMSWILMDTHVDEEEQEMHFNSLNLKEPGKLDSQDQR